MNKVIVLIIILGSFISNAQNTKGKIIDSYGLPIEKAYILNTTNNNHAHTNELGEFSIKKPAPNTLLKVSALGFKKTTFRFTDSNFLITLEATNIQLSEVVIQPTLSAINVITKIDLETSAVNSTQELLHKVPGLLIGQHAGGGKAEQMFLRGFDVDHGTDVALSVDGMPVNMVSHAHGQGYSDLHFVIPETVEQLNFGKGTYYASKGDFNTAGYVDFKTKDKLENSSVALEIGQFDTFRTLGLFDLLDKQKNQNAYLATEYIMTNGPFDSPQNFNRINILGKYSTILADNSTISILGSHFTSKWDASGQIPQRLVDAGIISRFGAVDDTEGGNTSRSNFNISINKHIDENSFVKANAFYSKYQFELYSNFTFFLEDPTNGDQIRQQENRNIYGINAELSNKQQYGQTAVLYQMGLGVRNDQTTDTELSHTLNRNTTLEQIKFGAINQSNLFSYLNTEITLGKLTINPGLRLDYFKFNYQDKLQLAYKTQTEDKIKLSPKFNFIYSKNANLQLYVKSGMGFHSNDTRVVVANSAKKILPTAIGTDIGTIWKPFPTLIVNSALWYLYLQQEFVYVGDAGVVEPSGKTKRMGIDLGLRYQLNNFLFFDFDTNYTHARSIEESKGEDYIPLAPSYTNTAGISLQNWMGFSGGIRYRYMDDRPANENNLIVANGYFVADCNLNYTCYKLKFGISIQNLFNTQWNETQFATESRLQNESNPVEEIHFTPGTPFFLKGMITYNF